MAAALVMYLGSVPLAQEPQTWSGVLSESKCGASHQATAASLSISERECAFHCLKGLAKFVIVDDQKNVIPIANQDFAGIPLRLARPVRVTGVLTDNGIVVSRIEPPLVHAHIGHVMIAWRDTPGQVGLLTIAQSDTRIAAAHALLLSKAGSLDDMKLHAGHILHALRSDAREDGPGIGIRRQESGSGCHAARRVHRGGRQRLSHCQGSRGQGECDADGDACGYRSRQSRRRSRFARPGRRLTPPRPLAIFSRPWKISAAAFSNRSRKCG